MERVAGQPRKLRSAGLSTLPEPARDGISDLGATIATCSGASRADFAKNLVSLSPLALGAFVRDPLV